jgi:hypothetical protein
MENITKSNEQILEKMIGDMISPFVKTHFTAANAQSMFSPGHKLLDEKMRDLTQPDLEDFNVNMQMMRAIIGAVMNSAKKLESQGIETIQYTAKQFDLETE